MYIVFFFLWWPGFEPRTFHVYYVLSKPTERNSRGLYVYCINVEMKLIFCK